jgi:hypothetical protein
VEAVLPRGRLIHGTVSYGALVLAGVLGGLWLRGHAEARGHASYSVRSTARTATASMACLISSRTGVAIALSTLSATSA